MPEWVNAGFAEYMKRLPVDYQLRLIEIPSLKRTKSSNLEQLLQIEGERLLAAATQPIIALDRQGKALNTKQLAQELQTWHDYGSEPSFLIGGPEGLSKACLDRSEKIWSLSDLTFPHPLVRILMAEQIYRAWSIISHHPYHRS